MNPYRPFTQVNMTQYKKTFSVICSYHGLRRASQPYCVFLSCRVYGRLMQAPSSLSCTQNGIRSFRRRTTAGVRPVLTFSYLFRLQWMVTDMTTFHILWKCYRVYGRQPQGFASFELRMRVFPHPLVRQSICHAHFHYPLFLVCCGEVTNMTGACRPVRRFILMLGLPAKNIH